MTHCPVPVQGQNDTAGNPLTAVPVPGKSLYSLANGKEINAVHHSVPTDRLCCTPAPQQLQLRPFCFVQFGSAMLLPRNSSQSCREVSPAERPIFLTRVILRFLWNILNLLFSPTHFYPHLCFTRDFQDTRIHLTREHSNKPSAVSCNSC